jgi:rhodanese-related sulfurtransferase
MVKTLNSIIGVLSQRFPRPDVQFLIENWMLILAALVSGGMLLWPKLSGGAGGGVTAAETVRLMNQEKAVVVDVCEPGEFAAGHIGGARSIPLGSLGGTAKGLPSNKAQPVVVVCAAGMRAQRGASVLRKAGFENVHVLSGGMRAGREATLPVETGSR